jgi:hypothetical protein
MNIENSIDLCNIKLSSLPGLNDILFTIEIVT